METSIELIRTEVIKMAATIEMMMNEVFDTSKDFQSIFALEKEVDTFHTKLDELCFKYLALKHPHARDLRFIIGIIKMNSDWERIGDLSTNIKRHLTHLKSELPLLKEIHHEVQLMISDVIKAFVNSDVGLASDVIRHDQIVNDLNRRVIRSIAEKKSLDFEEVYTINLMAFKLERMGDHATNIAEDIIFIESGVDIRHGNSKI